MRLYFTADNNSVKRSPHNGPGWAATEAIFLNPPILLVLIAVHWWKLATTLTVHCTPSPLSRLTDEPNSGWALRQSRVACASWLTCVLYSLSSVASTYLSSEISHHNSSVVVSFGLTFRFSHRKPYVQPIHHPFTMCSHDRYQSLQLLCN